MFMDTVITVSVIVVALGILAGIVFFILTLIQVRRTARQAEQLLKLLHEDVGIINHITGSIAYFTQKLNSPAIKAGALLSGLVSFFLKRRKHQ